MQKIKQFQLEEANLVHAFKQHKTRGSKHSQQPLADVSRFSNEDKSLLQRARKMSSPESQPSTNTRKFQFMPQYLFEELPSKDLMPIKLYIASLPKKKDKPHHEAYNTLIKEWYLKK